MRFPTRSFPHGLRLVLAWLGLGWGAGLGAAPPEPVVLQLPYTHQFEFAGVYAAEAQGYFREEGLQVEVRPNPYGKLPPKEIQAGRAQYGIYQAIRVLNDRLEGQPVVVMAAIMQHSPYALAVLRESGIRTVQDLIGKRVALEKEFRLHEIRRMLLMEGVAPDRVQFVTKKWDTNELRDGTADAMAIYSIDSPYDMRLQGQDILVLRPMDYGVDFYGDVLFTSEQELDAHPERVRGMRRAVLRGWAYALAHRDEMIQWIIDHYPDRPKRVTRERLQYEASEVARLVNQELIEIGTMNPGRWRVQADILTAAAPGQKLKPALLSGFIFEPNESMRLPRWVRWLGWLAATVATLGILGGLEYYRLQRVVQRRTRELRISETQYRELFEQVPVPIVVEDFEAVAIELEKLRAAGVLDLRAYLLPRRELVQELFLKKRIRAANTLALTKTGFTTLEDFDRRASEVMTEQAMAMYVEELVALWEGRDSLVVEKVYRMKTGQEIHTLLNWQVGRKDGRRDLSQVKLVYIDLTEQKQAERALRESERRYRELFSHSPVAMMEWDFSRIPDWFARLRATGVTSLREHLAAHPALVQEVLPNTPLGEANEAALQLLGARDLAELIEAMPRLVTPESISARVDLLCQLWEGNDPPVTGELTLRRMDGALRHLRYYRHGSTDGAARVRRSLTAFVDVTEQKQAEHALRESEHRYRELFESAVGGVYRSDLAGRLVSVNPAFARLLGYDDPAELMRRSGPGFAASLYVRPTRREEFLAQLGNGDHFTNFESEVRTRDGSTVWISENVHAIREQPGGRILFFDGFVTDITARRRLESELLRASKLEAVGILAGGIAHDFNNILTVVLGNVTLAEMDTEVTSSVSRMLRDAKKATLRARDLTQQLLTFAKGGDPVRAVVELPELLRESAGFAMHGANARAQYELPEQLWPANADKGQIGQVVQNLVINAVQAMPQGGTVTVRAANVSLQEREVGTLPAGDYVRLSVADNGVGIPSDHLAKIFDPYFTTKQSGSGLGLATVYSIIRKHQGHIEVESSLGSGTTFTFWLPAAPHDREESAGHIPPPMQLRGRILFMDDEEPIRGMAGLFFERLGLEHVLTEEGSEAVRLYREALDAGRPFDLVIMDLTVPGGMGGREAMQLIKAIHPEVRAIVSSGYSRDPVLANYRAHGFSGILPKPYSLEQLQQTLRGVFGPGLTQPPF